MKQHTFTKGGVFLAIMLVSLTFFACRQDVQVSPIETSATASSEKINAAKAWFNQNESILSNGKNHDFKNMKPIWEKAIYYDDIIEIPYAVNDKMPFPRVSGQFKQLGKQNLILQIKDNKYEPSIVSYVPFDVFKGTIESINVRNLQSEGFEGTVSTQGWDEAEFHRWHYNEGYVMKETTGKVVPADKPIAEDLSCTVAYEAWDLYTVASSGGVVYHMSYDGTEIHQIITCLNVGGGCGSPYCRPNNSGGGSSSTYGGLAAVDTGKTLTQNHVICPSSLTVTNGAIAIKDFKMGLLKPDRTTVPFDAGGWHIQTNILSGDPYGNAIGSLISQTFQRVLLIAAKDLENRGIDISSLSNTNSRIFTSNTETGRPLLNLNDFVAANFGPTFRTVTNDNFGVVRSATITARSFLNSFTAGYDTPKITDKLGIDCN